MIDQALDALQAIDPGCSRSEWIRIAMAAKAAGIDFEDFDSWSSNASNYESTKSCKADWDHIKDHGGITAATLFKYAKDAGWQRTGNTKREPDKTQWLWDTGTPATLDHPYIQRKWGSPHGLRVCSQDFTIKNTNVRGAIMVPCYTGDRVSSIQFITESTKLNMSGASQGDGYLPLGPISDNIYVVEGIGQAWAINALVPEATAVVSFGASRTKTVFQTITRKYPNANVIVVPDRGQENEVSKLGCAYVELPEDKPKNYDINDLLQDEKPELCLKILSDVKRPIKTEIDSSEVNYGSAYCSHAEQEELFKGFYYINSEKKFIHKEFPEPLDFGQFNNKFCNRIYPLDSHSKSKVVREAAVAYFNSTVNRREIIDATYFNPDEESFKIKYDAKKNYRTLNTYVPHTIISKPGDPSLFLEHLEKILPDENDRLILISYMAACVQNPGKKFTWCPLIQGVEGNGKSTIGKIMEYCIGDQLTKSIDESILNDERSQKWKESFLVIVQEIKSFENSKGLWEKMKSFITDQSQSIRKLYKDGEKFRAYYNFILFSNYLDAVKKTNSERRIVILKTAQQSRKDIDKINLFEFLENQYYPWLDEASGYAIIAHYLLNFQIPDCYNPMMLKHAPETSTTKDAIEYNRHVALQKLLEVIDQGTRDGLKGGFIATHVFNQFLKENGYGYLADTKKIPELLNSINYIKHPALNNGRTGSDIDGTRPYLYVLDTNDELLAITDPKLVVAEYRKHNSEVVILKY